MQEIWCPLCKLMQALQQHSLTLLEFQPCGVKTCDKSVGYVSYNSQQ